MGEVIRLPEQPKRLSQETLRMGMRVMLSDGQMHGEVKAMDKKGFSIHFDGTREGNNLEYDWEFVDALIEEK